MERLTVTSDGVKLNGFVLRPKTDVPVPVILRVTPYVQPGQVPADLEVGGLSGRKVFASAGYAVAQFNVRGTGDSEGCFVDKGLTEQKDLPLIIAELAKQSWSSGRVGMQGYSYHGTTPVMAAMQNPPALKTIVIGGTILDNYQFYHSPQGAEFIAASVIAPVLRTHLQYSLLPSNPSGAGTAARHACADALYASQGVLARGEVTGDRDAPFWKERNFLDRVPDITAATFVVHGFQDRFLSGHAFQDDWAWQTLVSAPKRMLIGQFGHVWPQAAAANAYPLEEEDWKNRLLSWFDYWLKGWGTEAPGLGDVDFVDSAGTWHKSDAWPPSATKGVGHSDERGPDAGMTTRRDEVLYLNNAKIVPRAGEESASFLAAPTLYRGETSNFDRYNTPCPDASRLVYTTEPFEERTVLAGNPFAWLNISSSAPGGIFEVQLFDLGPDFSCSAPPADLRPITEGTIDLQFHQGNYVAKLFPLATPTHVRVDLASAAEELEPGHRLAVVISRGIARWGAARDLSPLITLLGDGSSKSSHLVLPFIVGTLGGKAPTLKYAPTPFLPKCCTEAS